MTENQKEIKSSPMGFLAASTFEHSPNAHSVVCFCVCFHQDCFLEEIGLEPKALCFLKGVTTFPGPRNHGQGPWHKAQPCSSLGPEVQAGCQSEDHGCFTYEKQRGGKCEGDQAAMWAWCWGYRARRSRHRPGRRPELEGRGGMEVVIFTSLIDAECFNFAN